MGITKENNIIDLVRNGETQAALKILFKNKTKTDSIQRRHQTNEASHRTITKNLRLRSQSVDCSNQNNSEDLESCSIESDKNRLRLIDLSSFKFVYDTNEFRIGQKNLFSIQNNKNLSSPRKDNSLRECIVKIEFSISSNTLKGQINVNYQDNNGKSILHEACCNNNLQIVKFLIENSADIELLDKKGFRPFHYACQSGSVEIVSILLSHGVNCVDATNGTKETPLHLTIQYTNSIEIVNLILKSGGMSSLGMVNSSQGLTPFELACELGKLEFIKSILKYCSEYYDENEIKHNFSLLEYLSSCSSESIHVASKNGHNDIIRQLLTFGVSDINFISRKFQGTALHEACRYGRLQTVKLLLECGINMHLKNSFDQIAADVILKHKSENDIRYLLKEFSQAVRAVSVQPYFSKHSGALNFESNEIIVVLERSQQPIGVTNNNNNTYGEIYSSLGITWRGFILNKNNYTTRQGYFNALCVKIIDSSDNETIEYSQSKNVIELIKQGMTDSQIIFDWLCEFHMQQYYQNFVQAGYDLLTIFKTTPADLLALGILEPTHRQLIKQNMFRLDISELEHKFMQLLSSVETIEQLLQLIHLERYLKPIEEKNLFNNLNDFMHTISWEDLETEIGVQKLGHQKKLMLVAKRLKEVKSSQNDKSSEKSVNSKSLEDLIGKEILINSNSEKKISKPVPPTRKNSNISESQKLSKKNPPLPPRKSSVAQSHLTTLIMTRIQGNNKSSAKNLQTPAYFENKDYTPFLSSTSSSVISSGTISPSSVSSSSGTDSQFIDKPTIIKVSEYQDNNTIINSDVKIELQNKKKCTELKQNKDLSNLYDIDNMLYDLNKQLDEMLITKY